jgi:hypothetical protein
MVQYINKVAYGLSQPLIPENPTSIIALRAPTSADFGYALSTIWISKPTQAAYILVSISANIALWQLVAPAGGGAFSSLSSTGSTTLATAGVTVNSFGSTNGATGITILVGTGNLVADGAPTSTMAFGGSLTTGTILIGGSAESGAITLGSSTAAQTVNIALGSTASKTVVIASGTAGNTVGINGGANTVANVTNINAGAAGAASTVNILSGTATAGVQTANIATGNFAKIVNIATGTLGSTVNVLSGINSVAQVFNLASGASAADSTVNIMNGTSTAGTSTLNLASGAYAHAINVGTGAAVVNTIAIGGTGANVLTLNNTQTAGSVSIGAAMTTGTINIGSALSGLVTMPCVSVSAAGYTVVNSVRVGQAVYTGNVDASGATTVYTLTNTLISATSNLFVTANNLGSNDAQLTITRILPGAGTCAITLKNNGAAALNGNVQISFWVTN